MPIQKRRIRSRLLYLSLMTASACLLAGSAVQTASPVSAYAAQNNSPNAMEDAFAAAAAEFHVPESILKAVAYNESLWNQHPGQPSIEGGYGVMHLTDVTGNPDAKGDDNSSQSVDTDVPSMHTLNAAAQLLGVDPEVLKQDFTQNIRGGAALLAKYERDLVGDTPSDPAEWYGAVAEYSGSTEAAVAQQFADDVYATINQGAERTTEQGQHVVLMGTAVTPDKATEKRLHLRNDETNGTDAPNGLDVQYIPAAYQQFSSSPYNYGNYDLANRPYDGLDIRYIIIHDAEGTYDETINTFLNPSYVSAHYVVDSATGQITEMVRPQNVAWQAGNWYINTHSIGIEHSGYAVEGGTWYSEQMYHATARLVKYLADEYNIPLDRLHILGHEDVPGVSPYGQSTQHWDPAAYWDWQHFFDLLGASFKQANGRKDSHIVTIDVNYQQNTPALTYAGAALTPQPSDFVYLYTAPSFNAPLVSDPALHPNGAPGTTDINDWGDKAVDGQSFYVADQQGDWTAIYYGGQKVWFYNPNGKNTVAGSGLVITPKPGLTSIPVYGTAYPEASAFTNAGLPAVTNQPLQYTLPAGQYYVASGPVSSDYYYAKVYNQPSTYKVVKGNDQYYEISFNHRVAFVKASDVVVVNDSSDD
ncbi:MAG: N-acetylmuramoyl-L-alanine amidase [Alicyclobacillus sp.]|nr:N-acetylmuramoyl-L-alanine amidase [Alicyclobacillus sp.]